jgi:hypothetical protein
MMKIAMSAAASALLRALISRAGLPRDRILLTDVRSVEWQSLTFTGERHKIALRIPGPHSKAAVDRLCVGLDDSEFSIPGVIVADIAVAGSQERGIDGSTSLTIEALTVVED